jgi:hypothetical protein
MIGPFLVHDWSIFLVLVLDLFSFMDVCCKVRAVLGWALEPKWLEKSLEALLPEEKIKAAPVPVESAKMVSKDSLIPTKQANNNNKEF